MNMLQANVGPMFVRFICIVGIGLVATQAHASELRIISPTAGSTVRPGASVTVEVEAEIGISLEQVFVASPGGDAMLDQPPYRATVTVPERFTGPFAFNAIARKAGGGYVLADKVVVNVVPAEAPVRIDADVDGLRHLAKGPGAKAKVTVTGHYAGEVTRLISEAAFGTAYQSSDPSVVTVTPDGILEVVGPGRSVITVTNSGLQTYTVAIVPDESGRVTTAPDVTLKLSVTRSGFRKNPDGGALYSQEVVVRNLSNEPIPYPLSLVLTDLPEGVSIENVDGRTRKISPIGSAYVELEADDQTIVLAPGGTAKATLEFRNVDGRPINYTVRIFNSRVDL